MRKTQVRVLGRPLLIVEALALVTCGGGARSGESRFDTAPVDRGKITAKVTATGTLSALVTVQVGTQVSGRIQDLYVDFNSPVTKGQLIARIDPQLFEASMEQARANDVAAVANLAKSKVQAVDAGRQYARNKSLIADKLIAQADLDTSQANYDAAVAQVDSSAAAVEQARAALHQAEVNLAYTSILSPINGVVISRSVDVGQTVAASMQAPILFVIAEDLHKMQVDTSVAEADVGRLQAHMPATFVVDAYPGTVFAGVVRQIRNSPTTVQNVVTYDAVIDVDNPDIKLMPGMTANCTFITAQKDDVLRAANAALRFRPDAAFLAQLSKGKGRHAQLDPPAADHRRVWVVRDGKPKPVSIQTGITDGTVTEVADGDLHDKDVLIIDSGGAPAGSGPGGSRGGGFRMF